MIMRLTSRFLLFLMVHYQLSTLGGKSRFISVEALCRPKCHPSLWLHCTMGLILTPLSGNTYRKKCLRINILIILLREITEMFQWANTFFIIITEFIFYCFASCYTGDRSDATQTFIMQYWALYEWEQRTLSSALQKSKWCLFPSVQIFNRN